jgi:DNA-directed RNA polymerase subunit RPC12/RpoP
MVNFSCPDCAKLLEVADELAGRSIRCRHCDAGILVPKSTARPRPDSFRWTSLIVPFLLVALLFAVGVTRYTAYVDVQDLNRRIDGILADARKAAEVSNLKIPDNSPIEPTKLGKSTQPFKSVRPLVASDKRAQADPVLAQGNRRQASKRKPSDYAIVDWMKIHGAYGTNEASADAIYLNRNLQITFEAVIEKAKDGTYYAYTSTYGPWGNTRNTKHLICYFRNDQLASLATAKMESLPGGTFARIVVRGTCAGKVGSTETFLPGYHGAQGQVATEPVIQFKDCVLISQ